MKTLTYGLYFYINFHMHPQISIDLTKRLAPHLQNRLEWLEAQMAKRGIRGAALFSHLKSPPDTLNAATIKNWLEKKSESTPWNNWIAVKHGIRSYSADRARVHLDEELAPASQSRRAWLRDKLEQKNIRPMKLYKHIENSVENLKPRAVFEILSGKLKTVTWHNWKAIKKGVRSYEPTVSSIPMKKTSQTQRLDMSKETFHGQTRSDWFQDKMKEKKLDVLSLFNSMSLTTIVDLRQLEGLQNDTLQKIDSDFWMKVKKAVRAFEPAPAP